MQYLYLESTVLFQIIVVFVNHTSIKSHIALLLYEHYVPIYLQVL